jgi:DtxR family Mn-dependent transcriptional regulator
MRATAAAHHRRTRRWTTFPSSTVENYLKAIYREQGLLAVDGMVPTGCVASALGVTAGTATMMMHALAESGLVDYEPYSGVRLTVAGEKVAVTVVRRHRLVEAFLVQVVGMSWADVHAEAERLEHAVSDRLINRIDEMLGRPSHDPHGDPIPTADGTMPVERVNNLLTCPVQTSLIISRIATQDAAFLRFIEEYQLRPSERIQVETRDAAADAVTVRGRDGQVITLGSRAASRVMVVTEPC